MVDWMSFAVGMFVVIWFIVNLSSMSFVSLTLKEFSRISTLLVLAVSVLTVFGSNLFRVLNLAPACRLRLLIVFFDEMIHFFALSTIS